MKSAMNQELLLVNAITLLYRESQLLDGASNSAVLIRPLIQEIKLPEVSVGVLDTERDMLVALKTMCLEMCDAEATHKYVSQELLQKVRHAIRDDDALYHSFKEGVESVLEDKDLKLYCVNLRRSIRAYMDGLKITEILQEAAKTLMFKRDTIPNLRQFAQDVAIKLEPYQHSGGEKNASIVNEIDFSDVEGVQAAMERMDDMISDAGLMRTGWQGINRMLQGGFRRGEEWVIPALQHNFKTGFTLSIFRHLAMFNEPYLIKIGDDENYMNKKPLLLHISYENQLELNLPFLYRNIYEGETGQQAEVNLDHLSPEEKSIRIKEMSTYISEKLMITGFHIKMMQVNPSNFTVTDLFDLVLQLEAEGYQIHAIVCDYLNLMSKKGCDDTGPQGAVIRDLFRRVRNFMMPKKITFITPHQLSTEAKKHVRDGMEEDFLEQVANKGYYDGCKTIDQEVDGEINIHIVKEDGRSWLMVRRGKHRLIKQTKPEYLACTLLFEDIGDIRADIGGADTTRKRPGAGPMGARNEQAFYQFDNPMAA